MQVAITYVLSEALYTPLLSDGGIIKEEDGSIKLWYKPF